MIVATWNVNSISVRLEQALDWLAKERPNVLCLQETKSIDEKFPVEAFQNLGYQSHFFGEKAYNGVALISNLPVENLQRGFAHETNTDSKRFISARIGGLQILNCYIPNGQSVGSEKYAYKMRWLASLKEHIEQNCARTDHIILCGDFNIAPDDLDVYDATEYGPGIMCSPEERQALSEIGAWGLVDGFRLHTKEPGYFSWWDYRMVAFRRNLGFRIDHVWLSQPLSERCTRVWIDREPRKLARPSDHAPVIAEFSA